VKQVFLDYLGILWVLLLSSLTLIALVCYCNYNPLVDVMSKLGTGKGAIYFNIGLISSGHIGSIISYFRYKDFNKFLTVIGIITMSLLALVGWFPMPGYIHGVVSILLFSFVILFFLIYAILTRSRILIIVLFVIILFFFINIPLAEWIIFITGNVFIGITSTKFYYRKRSKYYKVQNI